MQKNPDTDPSPQITLPVLCVHGSPIFRTWHLPARELPKLSELHDCGTEEPSWLCPSNGNSSFLISSAATRAPNPHLGNSEQYLPSFGTLLWRIEVSRIWTLSSSPSLAFSQSFPGLPYSLSWLLFPGLFNHVTLRQYLPIPASILITPASLESDFIILPCSMVQCQLLLERGDGSAFLSSPVSSDIIISCPRKGQVLLISDNERWNLDPGWEKQLHQV